MIAVVPIRMGGDLTLYYLESVKIRNIYQGVRMTDYTQVDKEFDKAFTNRLMRVADGPSKEWEDGYNEMVEATKIFMLEAKSFLHSQLDKQRREIIKMLNEDLECPVVNEDYEDGYFKAINDALSSLQSKLGGK